MAQYKHFKTQQLDEVTEIRLVDPKLFETLIVNELQDELLSFIIEHHPRKLLIDFKSVTHCSTAVINGLLRAKKRLAEEGGQLKLCGMAKTVREAYKMLNLDGTVFDIYDDTASAIKAF
jgi:anti-anti-sigma regulatory factor